MTLDSVRLSNSINFKEKTEIKSDKVTDSIKSDYEKSPSNDTYEKQTTVEDLSETNKKGMSSGLKWFLGLGSAGIVAVLAFLALRMKKVPFEEVQKALSEIFDKDFSKEEAEALVKKYTELYKEKGSDTYYYKLTEQLKKDYGVEDVKTMLMLDNSIGEGSFRVGGTTSRKGEITIYPENMKKNHDESGFNTLFHELKHVRQYSELWKADSEKFLKALTEDGYKRAQKELEEAKKELIKAGMSKEEARKYLYDELYKSIKEDIEPIYRDLKKFDKDSHEAKKAMEYIGMLKDRDITPSSKAKYEEYQNRLYEKEAFKCGDNANILLKYIKQNLK